METLRILWMNWKCIKHPEAGGAEIYTHEVAKRLVKMGHEVTLLTSSFPGAKNKEIIDRYTVLRAGNRFTVYIRAREIYEKMFKGKVDVVIDEINTLPFFTVKYVRENVVALIHQLAREYWFYETPPPLSIVGYFLEPRYLKLYRKHPTITVSNSTKEDLKRLGFENIYIVPPGVSLKPLSSIPAKNKEPTIIFIGRLKKAKRPQHVIKAFNILRKKIKNAKLWIVGRGPLETKLFKIARKLHLENSVKFWGRINDKTKLDLLRKSHVLMNTSIREGWGLVVLEAYTQATPVVAYNVPGIRDSVKNLRTGILVKSGNVSSLADVLSHLLENESLWKFLARNALNFVKQFSWDHTAAKINNYLSKGIHLYSH